MENSPQCKSPPCKDHLPATFPVPPRAAHSGDTDGSSRQLWDRNPKCSRTKVGASRGSLRSCPGNPAQLSLTSTGMGTALSARGEACSGAPNLLSSGSQFNTLLGFQALNMRGSSRTSPPAHFPALALFVDVGCCSLSMEGAATSQFLCPKISPGFSKAATLVPCPTKI